MSEVRVRHFGIVITLLGVTVLGATLGGCGNTLSELTVADFNPLKGSDPFRASDYNYFYKGDVAKAGPVTAADLVGPDGRCAYAPAPEPVMAGPAPAPAPMPGPAPAQGAAPPPPPPAAAAPVAAAPGNDPINPRSNSALYFTAGPQTGPVTGPGPGAALPPEVRNGPRGISLAMTECQVMSIAGYTDRVEIGANPRGERTVTLTYLSGERPGIYHFRAGRLMSMERVAEAEAPKPKKPVKTAKVAKKKKPPQPPQ